ncbi:hypothetical protein KSP39_PZI001478 [Platanthera zijinensis]|uniref:Reverse transcriptase Ty1/copia-type domain-containing protein n=1 Tax=Platanthera zijinensis TaxID=2320716 RepID=A0AAP0C2Y5_9ASPA
MRIWTHSQSRIVYPDMPYMVSRQNSPEWAQSSFSSLFRITSLEDGFRYKVRLVAKDYAQKDGVDFNEVFSPVVQHTSNRILLVMATVYGMELKQLDVKTAFLHGDLEEEIYMHQPEGFLIEGKEGHVCKLKKSLYGLKQSPRQWYKRFHQFMTSIVFKRSLQDQCIYFKVFNNGSRIYLLLYVDGMLITSKNKEVKILKLQLIQEFEMKDLGAAKKILGMEIINDRRRREVSLKNNTS